MLSYPKSVQHTKSWMSKHQIGTEWKLNNLMICFDLIWTNQRICEYSSVILNFSVGYRYIYIYISFYIYIYIFVMQPSCENTWAVFTRCNYQLQNLSWNLQIYINNSITAIQYCHFPFPRGARESKQLQRLPTITREGLVHYPQRHWSIVPPDVPLPKSHLNEST